MATRTCNLSTEELVRIIEKWIVDQIYADIDGSTLMFYEDMLLIGPTDNTHLEIGMAWLAGQGISCTRKEFLRAALTIRRKSMEAAFKVRGLR